MTHQSVWSAVGQFPDMRGYWTVGSSRHPRTLSFLEHLVCQNFQGSCALLQDTPSAMNRSRENDDRSFISWCPIYFTVFGC